MAPLLLAPTMPYRRVLASRAPRCYPRPMQRAVEAGATCREACPVCDGRVVAMRGKLVCERCRAVVETCCDGGKQGA
ncbi:MAG: hypothetical protein KIT14_09700 [bacterium]|nr:hypothetical protein [bacterium]